MRTQYCCAYEFAVISMCSACTGREAPLEPRTSTANTTAAGEALLRGVTVDAEDRCAMVRTDEGSHVVLTWATHLSAHRSGDAVVLADGHGHQFELAPGSPVECSRVGRIAVSSAEDQVRAAWVGQPHEGMTAATSGATPCGLARFKSALTQRWKRVQPTLEVQPTLDVGDTQSVEPGSAQGWGNVVANV